jgi:hypothetical protein
LPSGPAPPDPCVVRRCQILPGYAFLVCGVHLMHYGIPRAPIPMTRSKTLLLSSVCAISLFGCDLPLGTDYQTEVAVISSGMLVEPYLQIPHTVQAGESFRVVLTTGGPNGCYSAAHTRVSFSGKEVRITPYHHRASGGACTMAPVIHERSVEIAPPSPGTIAVHVIARPSLAEAKPSVLATREVVVR